MDKIAKLKPRKGLIVRDPISFAALPEEGAVVDYSGPKGKYWRRRVRCGDCTIVKEHSVKLKTGKE